jgi:hypothetical protein
MCGMLFAKYEKKVRCLPVVSLCVGSQSAGMSPDFLAVCPFKQDKNQEDASEDTKHKKRHKRHGPATHFCDPSRPLETKPTLRAATQESPEIFIKNSLRPLSFPKIYADSNLWFPNQPLRISSGSFSYR